jgi:hypothetical protein
LKFIFYFSFSSEETASGASSVFTGFAAALVVFFASCTCWSGCTDRVTFLLFLGEVAFGGADAIKADFLGAGFSTTGSGGAAGGAFGAITIGVLDANALRALFLLLPIIYAPLWLCNNINSFKFTLIQ